MLAQRSARQVAAQRDRIMRQLARRRLIRFTKLLNPDYDISWHHELLADELDKVTRGETIRLAVFMPPQHGKSELISRMWPAQLIGLNPDLRIMATSYGDEMVRFNAGEIRAAISSTKYREMFGVRRPSLDRKGAGDMPDKANFWKFPGAKGYYLAASLDSGLTGRGFDVGIIDDPIKNDEEADSPTFRKRLETGYHSIFESRGSGMGSGMPERIVAVFTRWRYDDIGGYLLKLGERTGVPWRVLSLPAILDADCEKHEYDPREIGEALWPGRYPLSILEPRRAGMAARTWEAMYQQRPSDAEGSIFPPSRWSTFRWSEVQIPQ